MKWSGERSFDLVLIFLFALFTILALGYDPAPRRIPLLLSVPCLVLAVGQLVLAGRQVQEPPRQEAPAGRAEGEKETPASPEVALPDPAVRRRRELGFLGWLVFFYLCTYLIGFVWSIPLFLFLLVGVYFREKLLPALALALVTWAGVYLLFVNVFHINLYRGIIFLMLERASYL